MGVSGDKPRHRTVRGVLVGLVPPLLAAVVAAVGFRERLMVGEAAVRFGATMLLWVAIVLGVAGAVYVARRMLAGTVVGLVSVVLTQGVMVLAQSAEGRISGADLTRAWLVSLVMVAVPWALGMAFGWTGTHRRRTVYDGAPRDVR
jgi:hypothetical protein